MSELVPLFSNKAKEDAEREQLKNKYVKTTPYLHLFPEGNASADPMEGNWLPQIEHGHEWDARLGQWIPSDKQQNRRNAHREIGK